MTGARLIIRADASPAIGTGHVMRCLALAQAWQDAGGDAVFAMAEATSATEQRLRAEGCDAIRATSVVGSRFDAEQTVRLAREHGARWIVVDGYAFGGDYQRALKTEGLRLLFIDDNGHADHYSADLVLNQNAHASETLYRCRDASTRLLLGPQYALLRREFSSWKDRHRKIPQLARRVLVTMGGSDPENVTAMVIDAVAMTPELEVVVAVGGSNPHVEQLRRSAQRLAPRVRLIENANNMRELMAWADLAVTAAGTTSWEICFMGLPALIMVLAENQRLVAEKLAREGVVVSLGCSKDVTVSLIADQLRTLSASSEIRKDISARGRRLVDGLGAARAVAELTDWDGG